MRMWSGDRARLDTQFLRVPCVPMITWSSMLVLLRHAMYKPHMQAPQTTFKNAESNGAPDHASECVQVQLVSAELTQLL